MASRNASTRLAIDAGTADCVVAADTPASSLLGAEQRQRAGAARLDVHGAQRLGGAVDLLANQRECGVVEWAMIIVDELTAERLRHPLGCHFHLVERAHRIGCPCDVEQE